MWKRWHKKPFIICTLYQDMLHKLLSCIWGNLFSWMAFHHVSFKFQTLLLTVYAPSPLQMVPGSNIQTTWSIILAVAVPSHSSHTTLTSTPLPAPLIPLFSPDRTVFSRFDINNLSVSAKRRKTVLCEKVPGYCLSLRQKKMSRVGILGHQFDKRLKSFAPCYSQSLLLAYFKETQNSSVVLKILTKKSAKQENSSLFRNSIV
jgi:hypothetical protein